ncbi:MAG: cytochrome C, partial [Aphanizomenon flos-aquae LD13]
WWIGDHIKDGKHHLNFDEFSNYRIAKQYKKLDECIDELKEGGMPLDSYNLIHKDAVLTDTEKQALINWCAGIRDSIKAKYPADSLVIKRKK